MPGASRSWRQPFAETQVDMGRPAARVTDQVLHPLPGVLTPGPGSLNVHIGGLLAWRGIGAAAVAALQSAKATADATVIAADASAAAAAGTPGAPAAIAAAEATKAATQASMGAAISAAAAASGGADIHICATIPPTPGHGPGVVIDGSTTVFINNLPACRMLDSILEALGPMNKIIRGQLNVHIGDIAGVDPPGTALAMAAFLMNPTGSVINCGFGVDAAVARLTGTNPNATAPAGQDGSFSDIANRHNTTINWNQGFQNAFDAVQNGGPGTMAVVGIVYSSGTASHVVVLANDNGRVGIVEGQNWGPGQEQGVVGSVADANARYNADGGSNVGYGIIPPPTPPPAPPPTP
jgi:hypothetical protein